MAVNFQFICNLCSTDYTRNPSRQLLGFEHQTLNSSALERSPVHICKSCLIHIKKDLPKFEQWLSSGANLVPVEGTDEEASKVLGVNRLGVSVCIYETWESPEDAVTWGMSQGVFNAGVHAANSFNKLAKELATQPSSSTTILYKAWYEKVMNKKESITKVATQ